MRKKFVFYIVGILILSLAFSFLYLQESKADGETQILTEEEHKELVEFNESLTKTGGFFSLVGEELSKAGYKCQIAGMIYSMNDIRIYVIVSDSEVITDKTQEEINNIYSKMISKHNLNWEAFSIKVVHSDEIE